MGPSAAALYRPMVGNSDSELAPARGEDLPKGALTAFLAKQALEAEKAGAGDRRRKETADVSDETTLAELMELRCATHKMKSNGPHPAASKRKQTGAFPEQEGEGGEEAVARRKRQRRCRRSGGFLVACAPEGFVMDAFEFTGSESRAQRYLFLARLKALQRASRFAAELLLHSVAPRSDGVGLLRSRSYSRFAFHVRCRSADRPFALPSVLASVGFRPRLFAERLLAQELYPAVKVILHDDACHLRRFADNRASASKLAADLAFPAMTYILDRFHAPAHVDPWCVQNVHPGLDCNRACVDGRNTSRCEQCFSWLRRYKHMFRTMGRWTGVGANNVPPPQPNERLLCLSSATHALQRVLYSI